MRLIRLNKSNLIDATLLQTVIESAPRYSIAVSGELPTKTSGSETFNACPANFNQHNKYVFAIEVDGEFIGCMDLLRGYPSVQTVVLGLILISEKHQGQGHGRKAFETFQSLARQWSEIRSIRIAVVSTNGEVLPFWKKLGFSETGYRTPYQNGLMRSEAIILEKNL